VYIAGAICSSSLLLYIVALRYVVLLLLLLLCTGTTYHISDICSPTTSPVARFTVSTHLGISATGSYEDVPQGAEKKKTDARTYVLYLALIFLRRTIRDFFFLSFF
jgi:hypothetical protein